MQQQINARCSMSPSPSLMGWARNERQESRIKIVFLTFLLLLIVCGVGGASDWATYRSNITRSAITCETVGPRLFLQWKYIPTHPPKPAWPMPAGELPRMHNDNAYNAVIAGDNVYFGSCVTNKVYSIDAAKGRISWTFFTEGPVRFAPAVYDSRVYVGSDDGYVYCLDAEDGSLVWKYRAGPSDEKVIGNGRMISLWPVRTGVLVDEGVVYFGAGVFPYEGLYICALKAEDGSVVWKNDTIGDRSHELNYGGMSPHGYLLASPEIVYVPSGRSMPAAFDRKTGKFLFYAYPGGKRGGVWALLDNDQLISGVDYSGTPHKLAFEAKTGKRKGDVFGWFPGIDMVLTRDLSYVLSRDGIYSINRAKYTEASKQADKVARERKKLTDQLEEALARKLRTADEKTTKDIDQQIDELNRKIAPLAAEEKRLRDSSYRWRYSGKGFGSLIVAGDIVFAGGDETVVGIDAETGKEVWRSSVSGRAVGLAAAGGRLVVSTDAGPVYCFGGTEAASVKEIKMNLKADPYPSDDLTETYRNAAQKILAKSGVKKGYCLVLDCGHGRLAYELAQRTELQIVGLEKDPDKLRAARESLEAAGLLGSRVVVEPWDIETLPDYFANLIVSDSMLFSGQLSVTREAGYRVLRPFGGVACLSRHEEGELSWRRYVRGPLEGAGSWTQQYCNPQNTACSDDELVDGPLGILWFGEPGPQGMVERHGNAQSPLSMDGRLFVQGEEVIMAVDAFNGTMLWKRQVPGAVRVHVKADCGNLAVTQDGLYVAASDKCYRLEPSTGRTMRIYEVPPSSDGSPRRWGYVSVIGNVLYGSTATAMDEEYGALLKVFVKDGKWRNIDDIPEEHRQMYEYSRKQYPDPQDLWRAAERSGTLYRTMTSFAHGGEFMQKNAVTENLMVSDKVFAVDTETGELLWVHDGDRIANITVVLGDGKIFFAESTITERQKKRALSRRRRLIKTGIYQKREGILEELEERKRQLAENLRRDESFDKSRLSYLIGSLESELYEHEADEGHLTYDDADVRVVVALDAVSGEEIWKKPVDLTGCCGDKMGAAYSEGMLLFFGNHGNHDAWRFKEAGLQWRRITVLSAENGDVFWSRALNYRTRPVIVRDRIILEPRACELRTGETIMRTHPITGNQVPWEFLRPGHTCGITAASAHGLFYRSGCTAFYDVEEDRGVTIFGAYRPGCAITVIPASGLLLSPESAAGCTCSYPIRCSMALMRKAKRTQPWTVYVTPGEMSPAKHFAINFGAMADMKDDDGTVWFGYPNPKTSPGFHHHYPDYGVKFDLRDKVLPGDPASREPMGYFCRDFKGVNIAGTDKPWLFTSGCRGLLRCEIPLINDTAGQEPGVYTVRLGFEPLSQDRAGRRIFDVNLQGHPVLKDFDVVATAGEPDRAVVRQFNGIRVKNVLVLEMVPRSANPRADEAPIINFIEVIREDTGAIGEIASNSP